MKRLVPLFAAAGGLLAGGLLGWVLGAPGPAAPVVSAPVEILAPAPPVDPPEPLPADPEPDSFAALIEAAPAVAARATGEIRGSVLLLNGRPLPGVEIRAVPHLPAALHHELADHAARIALRHAGARATRTDANGEYVLNDLDGELFYSVSASLRGYDIRTAGRLGAAMEFYPVGYELHFVANDAVVVRLDVRLPDGRQAARAQIGCSGENQPGQTSFWYWTPTEPTRAFEPGEWQLTFRAGESNEYTCEPVMLELKHGEPFPTRTIQLASAPGVIGTVTVPADGPRIPLSVELQIEQGGEYTRVNMNSRRPGERNPARVNTWRGAAAYEFFDIEPGRYRVVLMMFDKPVESRDVEVTNTVVRADFTLPEPDIKDFIVVRVTGPDGPVTENVRFNLSERRGGSRSGRSAQAMLRDSEHWLPRPERRMEGSTFTLDVRAGGLGNKSQEFDPETTNVIDVYFGAPAFITVEILGFEQHPQRENLMQHVWKSGTEFSLWSLIMPARMSSVPIDQSKRRHGPFEPGSYEIGLFVQTQQRVDALPLERRTVTLLPGENHATLTAPQLYSFVVVIPQQFQGRQIIVQNSEDPGLRIPQNDWALGAEEFKAENLKAGEYIVSMSDVGEMTVSLPAADGRRVEFQPKLYNAFQMRLNRGSEFKDLGLREHDIVIEIDGAPITDMAQGHRLLNEAATRASTTWTVLRQGSRVQITFSPPEIRDSGLGAHPIHVSEEERR